MGLRVIQRPALYLFGKNKTTSCTNSNKQTNENSTFSRQELREEYRKKDREGWRKRQK